MGHPAMIETRARVIEAGDGVALVEAERQAGCGHCDSTKGCGKSAMSKLFCTTPRRFEVIDSIGKKPGDEVRIAVHDGALLKGSMAVYIVPMLSLLGGALLGNAASGSDAGAVLGGFAGLFIGFLWARFYSAANRGNTRFQPYITE